PLEEEANGLGPSPGLIFPDRRGYGRSTPVDELPIEYHHDAAVDLGHFLDAVARERVALWGHSDGAITAALFAAEHPERVSALVLEAIHFRRAKSREFFARFAADPGALPPPTIARLRADHGERWRGVVAMHSRAWLAFHQIGGDFYEGRLERIACPALLLFGEGDPHTPPSEVAELARHLRHATLQPIPEGGHSPHSE